MIDPHEAPPTPAIPERSLGAFKGVFWALTIELIVVIGVVLWNCFGHVPGVR